MDKLLESQTSDSIQYLQDLLKKQGYLLIKSFFSVDIILNVRRKIIEVLAEEKWGEYKGKNFLPVDPVHRINSEHFHKCIQRIMEEESIHDISQNSSLTWFLSALLGEPVFPHPRKMVRITYPYKLNPKDRIPPHQDLFYVKGERDTFTTWIPLGDYPPSMGGLEISPGTHTKGLFPTQENAEGRFGCNAIEENLDNFSWLNAHYKPGDLLIMHSLTLHRAGVNESEQFRISLDCRFSSSLRNINEEQLLPPYFPKVAGWDKLSKNWKNPERFRAPNTLKIDPKDKKPQEVLSTISRFAE